MGKSVLLQSNTYFVNTFAVVLNSQYRRSLGLEICLGRELGISS